MNACSARGPVGWARRVQAPVSESKSGGRCVALALVLGLGSTCVDWYMVVQDGDLVVCPRASV